jgi:hypothetical protein
MTNSFWEDGEQQELLKHKISLKKQKIYASFSGCLFTFIE